MTQANQADSEKTPPIPPDSLKAIMEALRDDDPSVAHVHMDAVMVGVLRGLGYNEAMDIYQSQEKWYE